MSLQLTYYSAQIVSTNLSIFYHHNKRHSGSLFRAETKLWVWVCQSSEPKNKPNTRRAVISWESQSKFDLYGALTTWSPASEWSDSIHFSGLRPRPVAMSDLFKLALSPRHRLIWVKPGAQAYSALHDTTHADLFFRPPHSLSPHSHSFISLTSISVAQSICLVSCLFTMMTRH